MTEKTESICPRCGAVKTRSKEKLTVSAHCKRIGSIGGKKKKKIHANGHPGFFTLVRNARGRNRNKAKDGLIYRLCSNEAGVQLYINHLGDVLTQEENRKESPSEDGPEAIPQCSPEEREPK